MIFPSKALSLTRKSVVLLCFLVVLISSLLSAQTFLHSDSVVFVSEDSYLYAESPIYISSQNLRKASFKKWSGVLIKTSCSKVSHKKSIRSPTENTCYKSSPTGRHTFGLFPNSSSIAFIGSSFPVKLQHKIIPSSFILFISARRDEQKHVHFTSLPFQLKPITINHFGRPPPVLQS
ncbi:hypothetical protein [Chryseobacterium sp. POE27]|uniref:hypothetical protein n=1 Tax=Chryseobacterium sp. POE27 TaxID=3138177 RepID=UPI00321A594B